MIERWLPVIGYEDCYLISDKGRLVRISGHGNAKTPCWKIRIPAIKYGYTNYHLCKNGVRRYHRAHKMVWEAFRGPIPKGKELNHIDSDRANPALSNLELMTRSENAAYAFSHNGRPPTNNPSPGSRNGSAKLTEADIPKIFAMREDGMYQYQIAETFGVSQPMIGNVLRRKNWRHVK